MDFEGRFKQLGAGRAAERLAGQQLEKAVTVDGELVDFRGDVLDQSRTLPLNQRLHLLGIIFHVCQIRITLRPDQHLHLVRVLGEVSDVVIGQHPHQHVDLGGLLLVGGLMTGLGFDQGCELRAVSQLAKHIFEYIGSRLSGQRAAAHLFRGPQPGQVFLFLFAPGNQVVKPISQRAEGPGIGNPPERGELAVAYLLPNSHSSIQVTSGGLD
jgi:hypothetical protein